MSTTWALVSVINSYILTEKKQLVLNWATILDVGTDKEF